MNKFLIAVVDDEIDITHLLSHLLSDDYHVMEFNTPQSYLDYLSNTTNRRPDLLICDYDMPTMNGLKMVQIAQTRGHTVPFIVLSGYLTKDNVLEALSYGVFSVLEKPIGVPILMQNIESLIKEHRLLATHQEVRQIVTQLTEAYGHLSLLLEQYVPSEILEKVIVEKDPATGTFKKLTFTELIESLEQRLKAHFQEQVSLEENKRKNKPV